MPRPSVSTWALHPLLGTCASGRPGDPSGAIMASNPGSLDLLDVPAELKKHGFGTMELCHFHIPSTDPTYLGELKSAIQDAGVELWSVLIDDGDINHPETGDRDRDWVAAWLERAEFLGSKCSRVVAGKQPLTEESLDYSNRQLRQLADGTGVRILTENWFDTMSTPDAVSHLLDSLQGDIGLCFDFGNWGGPSKYENLAAIARYADSCHAKCQYNDGKPDVADFTKCLEITRAVGFDGPYTLVHGEPGRVWETLAEQRAFL